MRILLVEDEEDLATSLKRGLSAKGFVVDVAHDGMIGSTLATTQDYDVIILDIMLPRRNGYLILSDIRRTHIWTPVLMLTAKNGDYDQTDAFELGADDYLTKPFSFPILVARLHALMRRGLPSRPTELTCGSLRLNPQTHRAWRGDTELDLTAKEFLVLQYFMEHPGEVLSKVEILDNVWDDAIDMSENVVEVYIRTLRKIIDIPFTLHTLETLRGAGYRLVSDTPPSGETPQ